MMLENNKSLVCFVSLQKEKTSYINNSPFQISWSLGFNGDLPQNFTIEVIENETLDNVVYIGDSTEAQFTERTQHIL